MIDPWVIREKFAMKIYNCFEAFDRLNEWPEHRIRIMKLYTDMILNNNKNNIERVKEYKRILNTDKIIGDISGILYMYFNLTPE